MRKTIIIALAVTLMLTACGKDAKEAELDAQIESLQAQIDELQAAKKGNADSEAEATTEESDREPRQASEKRQEDKDKVGTKGVIDDLCFPFEEEGFPEYEPLRRKYILLGIPYSATIDDVAQAFDHMKGERRDTLPTQHYNGGQIVDEDWLNETLELPGLFPDGMKIDVMASFMKNGLFSITATPAEGEVDSYEPEELFSLVRDNVKKIYGDPTYYKDETEDIPSENEHSITYHWLDNDHYLSPYIYLWINKNTGEVTLACNDGIYANDQIESSWETAPHVDEAVYRAYAEGETVHSEQYAELKPKEEVNYAFESSDTETKTDTPRLHNGLYLSDGDYTAKLSDDLSVLTFTSAIYEGGSNREICEKGTYAFVVSTSCKVIIMEEDSSEFALSEMGDFVRNAISSGNGLPISFRINGNEVTELIFSA